jgi:tryptophan-rich sensory protein
VFARVWVALYVVFAFLLWRALRESEWKLVGQLGAHLVLQLVWCREFFERRDAATSLAAAAGLVGLGVWMVRDSEETVVRLGLAPVIAWCAFAAAANAAAAPRFESCKGPAARRV